MALPKATDFIGEVEKIRLAAIKPSDENPRGPIDKNENYLRLTASIDQVGVLVPIVVRQLPHKKDGIKYELVDGERRFWAARECGKEWVPAHILSASNSVGDLRKLMFHTHMTREDWPAMAQCRALSEVYPELDKGLRFEEKREWVKRLSKETVMGTRTASDRIHFLAWPKLLKEKAYAFDDHSDKDIYSYVLAIEISIVEQSRDVFQDFYNHGNPPEVAANKVRESLLNKTIQGLQNGLVTNREQIRSVSPLFSVGLPTPQRKIALSLFKKFVADPLMQFDDVRTEVTSRLPEALKEKPPKPRRVIADVLRIERILRQYERSFVEESVARPAARARLVEEFLSALEDLAGAIDDLRERF